MAIVHIRNIATSHSHEREAVQALAKIKEQRSVAADARKKSADLKAGMDIFSIPHPPYRELGTMEADVEKLQGIWSIVAEWEDSYNSWETGKFKEIKVQLHHSRHHFDAGGRTHSPLRSPCTLSHQRI